MAKVVVVTSGKGGVGKTTTAASLGAALAREGQRVVLVDFDVGLRNLDLIMGAERRVVYDVVHVVQGTARLSQALIRDKHVEMLYLLAASQTRDKDALTDDGVERVIRELRKSFDWIICDSPAGIERGAMLAMRHADQAIVVANAEISSVRDSDRIIGLLDAKTDSAKRGNSMEKHLLITRFDASRGRRGEMLAIEDILEVLSIPLLGVIPESRDVLRASNFGCPVVVSSPSSLPARAYIEASRRLMGQSIPLSVHGNRGSFLTRLLGRRAA
jgi:septum site-determining protein MinD